MAGAIESGASRDELRTWVGECTAAFMHKRGRTAPDALGLIEKFWGAPIAFDRA